MSRGAWRIIRDSKFFYVNTYRRVTITLVISTGINLFLGMAVYYLYFGQPEPEYYATSGVTPPILLTAMDSANYTTVPLLPEDDATEDITRAIPE